VSADVARLIGTEGVLDSFWLQDRGSMFFGYEWNVGGPSEIEVAKCGRSDP
jgi:hypothetical protein